MKAIQADMTTLTVNVIVNAANCTLLGARSPSFTVENK
jgi:O-acetyl-ADP-ribose deacetylase (regulator of RNase III)